MPVSPEEEEEEDEEAPSVLLLRMLVGSMRLTPAHVPALVLTLSPSVEMLLFFFETVGIVPSNDVKGSLITTLGSEVCPPSFT